VPGVRPAGAEAEGLSAEVAHRRSSGVLLHPTSLPGRFGIGDLGPAAVDFLDFLQAARQQWWQVLPLGPTGYGDSPYQAFSAFAGNPLLVSPELLRDRGLLTQADLDAVPPLPEGRVDYGAAFTAKTGLLGQAWTAFKVGASGPEQSAFADFRERHKAWVEDYALYRTLKDAHGGDSWDRWPAPLRDREPEALTRARAEHEDAVSAHAFWQYLFFTQWGTLRKEAQKRGLRIMGDVPIFVSHDSSDVWQHPQLFKLDPDGRPTVVAGVPPDYFSSTGQCWGNPHYRWDVMEKDGFSWWLDRFRATFHLVDLVRLDHFRGFVAAWEVPGGEDTAVNGRWVPGPGAKLFEAARGELGHDLPFVAENLGLITPDVEELRERFGLAGMAILQFAFGDLKSDNPFLPHNYPRRVVAYTGTHDNDTTAGWWAAAAGEGNTQDAETLQKERSFAARYLASDGREIHWDFVRAAWSSVADVAIAPAQDLLGEGSEARMNLPGAPNGNWGWRLRPGQPDTAVAERLRELTELYGRSPAERSGPA
jgi:4-alpha-glucanotransferase